jgi:hypothetical protein
MEAVVFFLSLLVYINLQTEVDTSFLTRLNLQTGGCYFSKHVNFTNRGECNFSNHGNLTIRGNSICGVMVSVLASGALDRGFYPRSGQTKDYEIGMCCFSASQPALRR